MRAIFVLIPGDPQLVQPLARALDEVAPLPGVRVRRYPPADDRAHLLSLVRAGRDPVAVRWLRGLVACVLLGSIVGLATAGILAGAFDMFGGLVAVAIGFGAVVGAFLGGFTAAMTGTEVARDEVRALAAAVRPGDVLVSVAVDGEGTAAAALEVLVRCCDELGLAWRRRE